MSLNWKCSARNVPISECCSSYSPKMQVFLDQMLLNDESDSNRLQTVTVEPFWFVFIGIGSALLLFKKLIVDARKNSCSSALANGDPNK